MVVLDQMAEHTACREKLRVAVVVQTWSVSIMIAGVMFVAANQMVPHVMDWVHNVLLDIVLPGSVDFRILGKVAPLTQIVITEIAGVMFAVACQVVQDARSMLTVVQGVAGINADFFVMYIRAINS
jgi:hypothetical protein